MSDKDSNKYSEKRIDLDRFKINLKIFNKNDKVYKDKIISLENFINQSLPGRQ